MQNANYMNYTDLMFQLKGKPKIHSFKHCFVEFFFVVVVLVHLESNYTLAKKL